MLHYYAIGDVQKLLKLPLVTFWMLSRNIDRITAEQDIRKGRIGMLVQSQEGFTSLMEDLQKQLGRMIEFDEAARAMSAKPDTISKEDKAALNALGDLSNVRSR